MKKKPHLPARAIAAQCCVQVIVEGQSLGQCLEPLQGHPESAFIQALCFAVLRHYNPLTAVTRRLLNKPIKSKYADIQCLLLIGLHELSQQQNPDYACVNEIVNAAKALQKNWACALLNRCCRDFARQREEHLEAVAEVEPYPSWWQQRWQQDWPQDYRALIKANLAHAPMWCRLNTQHNPRDEYLAQLAADNINAYPHPDLGQALCLPLAPAVSTLPGFAQGSICVQDVSAQCAAPLLDCAPGDRVLDACCAPGGKTTHLFESQPQLAELVAVDCSSLRLQRVTENCQRQQVPAKIIAADLLCEEDWQRWWDGHCFDRILLDAPCSGSGVIRRHPDIIFGRTAEMITALARQQKQLLAALWPRLKKGGRLLYVTCSVVTEENDNVIADFLTTNALQAKVLPLSLPWGRGTAHGWQCLPGEGDGDGFYFCLLEKI